MLKGAEVAGRALGVQIQFVDARGLENNFDRAFSDMTSARAGGLTVLPSARLLRDRRLVDLAAKSRLPAVYTSR
jgi:hypothetical protein